ncbi:MAG: hypothetical protein A2021_08500 [Elusimicrobia bacterium GWF2_52_66]|nr:MAG: hypothetical protein A2X33_07290 [Elusimicrobia bacterium GWA2_51_34]OGR84784.1 MAG: hypothetical protein A2021_08500 [Elusimicrobia bacterium GWF2_52_66]HAF95296.1 hypothetical protein [Elusimicrobiota bacterium]HCE96932.1 hypothetical protein [Elusimicrobiota bacterium]
MSKRVIVIGSGPGGYPAALRLKELGAEVSIVEARDFGGTCLNRGCIPSKTFLDTGRRVHAFEGLRELLKDGSDAGFSPSMLDWEKVKARRSTVVLKLRASLEKLFQTKKIEVIRGRAAFTGKGEATITTPPPASGPGGPDKVGQAGGGATPQGPALLGQSAGAGNIAGGIKPHSLCQKGGAGPIKKRFDAAVLAAGTRPGFPAPFAEFKAQLTDSDRIFDLPRLPGSILIVGGGVIGLEFACFFNAMGVEASVLELLPDILAGEDPQVTRAVRSSFEKRGVKFHFGKKAVKLEISRGLKTVTLEDGTQLKAEEILVGAGRVADLSGMGLETLGLEWNGKGVKVNEFMQTASDDIYAVGDINGISTLAHSATRQGEIAAENIFGAKKTFDAGIAPKCVYAWPEVGTVGLNIAQAQASGIAVKTSRAFFAGIGKAIATGDTEGFVQLVFDAGDETVLGAQIVGGPATELIHLIALAVKMKLKRADLQEIIYAHPTMSEAVHEALNK